MPKVSVIIPVYNVEKFLARCLDSVINQTFNDFEIVCVNDGSPDNSATILERYMKLDKRVKVITQENQGLSMARNNGVENASGEYICFLDSDDVIHPQCLEVASSLAEKYQAELVSYKLQSVRLGNDTELFKKRVDINTLDIKVTDKPVFLGTHREKYKIDFSACCKLYKRSILEGIKFISGITMEDYPHTYAVIAKSPKTVAVNEAFYFYTVNEESIIHNSGKPKTIRDYHIGINSIYEIYKQPHLQKELDFLIKNFIPNILNQQLARCRHANKEVRPLMYKAFAEELRDLHTKRLLCFKQYNVLKSWIYTKLNS
ncbi:MAG: glycosyltransferase family 2 protein [Phascolarctobacterium sp.]|nr:glycosyltransferase family 2 protein [Phascolarctobacterium sp.]